ncbi:MAG TPA: OadG family protein [Propionicimonas sp.]|jgi:sodium pump decarboxylase gamma subunit
MDNIGFGLWMTAMGMGTVFALLLLLMLLLRVIGWADERASRRAPVAAVARTSGTEAAGDADALTAEEIAAITIAVITHARVRRGQAAPAMRQVAPGSQLFASRWVAVGRSYQNQPWKSR